MGGAITTLWTACLPVYHGAITTLLGAIPTSSVRCNRHPFASDSSSETDGAIATLFPSGSPQERRCNHHPFYPPHSHQKHGAIATFFGERLASVDKKVIPVQSPPGCGAITTPKDGAIATRKDGAITTPLKPV